MLDSFDVSEMYSLDFSGMYMCCDTSQLTWWRHHMEASSALLALCTGNSPVFLCHQYQLNYIDIELIDYVIN